MGRTIPTSTHPLHTNTPVHLFAHSTERTTQEIIHAPAKLLNLHEPAAGDHVRPCANSRVTLPTDPFHGRGVMENFQSDRRGILQHRGLLHSVRSEERRVG